ncbi:hypothetical protein EDEG_01926, partial [Edhazardia aedis USNM 41457]
MIPGEPESAVKSAGESIDKAKPVRDEEKIKKQVFDKKGKIKPEKQKQLTDKKGNIKKELTDDKGKLNINNLDEKGNIKKELLDENGNVEKGVLDQKGKVKNDLYDEEGNTKEELLDDRSRLKKFFFDKDGILNKNRLINFLKRITGRYRSQGDGKGAAGGKGGKGAAGGKGGKGAAGGKGGKGGKGAAGGKGGKGEKTGEYVPDALEPISEQPVDDEKREEPPSTAVLSGNERLPDRNSPINEEEDEEGQPK